jgi:hypothetical protein
MGAVVTIAQSIFATSWLRLISSLVAKSIHFSQTG